MKIFIKARPGVKQERITENSELFGVRSERHFVVSVKERAVDGKANEAIEAALAKYFKVAPSCVSIISGHTSRDKVVEVVI